jgi:hypothetical protein
MKKISFKWLFWKFVTETIPWFGLFHKNQNHSNKFVFFVSFSLLLDEKHLTSFSVRLSALSTNTLKKRIKRLTNQIIFIQNVSIRVTAKIDFVNN